MTRHNTVNRDEIRHFEKDSSHWWNPDGPFAPLHRLTPARMGFLRDRVLAVYPAIRGLSVLDIGCGGGLVCEPFARLGAKVTGIDADRNAVAVATAHAAAQNLDITYKTASTDDLRGGGKQYDVVTALEIIEHVDNPTDFVADCLSLTRPGGLCFFSTLNKTPKSWLLGIVAAEYILGWVPRGTHRWRQFVRPADLATMVRQANGQVQDIKGIVFNPLENDFQISDKDIDVNYIMAVQHAVPSPKTPNPRIIKR